MKIQLIIIILSSLIIHHAILAQVNSSFDKTFDNDGIVILPSSLVSNTLIYYYQDKPLIDIQDDSKIVMVCNFVDSTAEYLLIAKYLADGSYDQKYGTEGISAINLSNIYSVYCSFNDDICAWTLLDIIINNNNKLFILGTFTYTSDEGEIITKYSILSVDNEGELNSDFGYQGALIFDNIVGTGVSHPKNRTV